MIAGNVRASTTCQQLFGHYTQGSAHDFPSRLDALVLRTHGRLGTARSIAFRHTILPFYLRFCEQERASRAIDAVAAYGMGPLKARLGMLATKFGASHPLKVCPRCMEHDQELFRVAYWHVSHQIPGVWICPLHLENLKIAAVKSNGVGRFMWYLPEMTPLHDSLAVDDDVDRASKRREMLLRLGKSAIALYAAPEHFTVNQERFGMALRAALVRQHLMGPTGRLRHAAFAERVLDVTRVLRTVDELSALPNDAKTACAQFSRLIYGRRTGSHPLRYLVLIHCLFDSWEDFHDAYEATQGLMRAENGIPSREAPKRVVPSSDPRRETYVDLLRRGVSVRAASKEVGVAVNTGLAWAATASIVVTRRPKLLMPNVRKEMVHALLKGDEKAVVANRSCVSLQTVTNLLRGEIGLHDKWRDARFERAKEAAHRTWLSIASQRLHLSRTEIRKLRPATFAWLYRNDRSWLNDQVAIMGHADIVPHALVDWDLRDSVLARLVEDACAAIDAANPGQPIALWQIYQHVPKLKRRLSRLDRLPLTRKAIERVRRQRREYCLRLC